MVKLIPLVLFLALVGFLAKGLTLDPREVPSPLIDKPAPEFRLPTLPATGTDFKSADMQGQVWILNVWASWCRACVTEHPLLVDMAAEQRLPIMGLNYKDTPEAAMAWLGQLGNPYNRILDDREGRVGLDWGVYGVPETFVIDRSGQVRYKHIGPLNETAIENIVEPLIEELLAAPS